MKDDITMKEKSNREKKNQEMERKKQNQLKISVSFNIIHFKKKGYLPQLNDGIVGQVGGQSRMLYPMTFP